MKFDIELKKCQLMLNEITNGYYSVCRTVALLKESILQAHEIHKNNNKPVCVAVRCIQEILYFSAVSDIKSWFIDPDRRTASLCQIFNKIKRDDFRTELVKYYSCPPKTIRIDNGNKLTFWYENFVDEKTKEFKELIDGSIEKYEEFCDSDITIRIKTLRDKYIDHKEFTNNNLYSSNQHRFDDAENCLIMLESLVFDLNKVINKSVYVDDSATFCNASKQFWSSLKST